MSDFGMDNTRVKDLFDIAAPVRNGSFDVEAVARSLTLRDRQIESVPLCVTDAHTERRQPAWEEWLATTVSQDSGALAEFLAEIRPAVEAAPREAARLQERALRPGLRLVSSR